MLTFGKNSIATGVKQTSNDLYSRLISSKINRMFSNPKFISEGSCSIRTSLYALYAGLLFLARGDLHRVKFPTHN